jgi:adenosylcobyric acid synthase
MPPAPARVIMVQGTASGVGKSLLCTALCRIYARRGLHVRPFKAQNMSNNAAVTTTRGEIGRAQWLQAVAARAEPDVRMNPVLLKPLADTRSDVVVLGRSRPELSALPWHDRRDALWPHVTHALDGLREDADVVVVEGAGSPAETNLRRSDIVNMAVARYASSPVIVAADIDRGGAFASLFGTWSLLEPADRALVRGFLLNRFRGDASLLHPAPDDLARRTGVPVLGVVPHVRHALPEEDAMGMASGTTGDVDVAAVRLPHVANFDDLDPLAAEPGVRVRWVVAPAELRAAHAIVLPGTRNTIDDLRWLWSSGLAAAIRARAADGVPVLGICGGYQMLGTLVEDPDGIEGGGDCHGLGLLDVATTLAPDKRTCWTDARVLADLPGLPLPRGTVVRGYEIHHGVTAGTAAAWLAGEEGVVGAHRCADGRVVLGAYLHALFADDGFRGAFLALLGARASGAAWAQVLDVEIDRVADVVQAGIDVDALDGIVFGAPLVFASDRSAAPADR